jgi:hypothetical protein
MVLGSCSSDSENNSTPTPEPAVVIMQTSKITSYSKNSGESGETISIYGEIFFDKISDIKITFDGVAATIVSTSATKIKFVLPQTIKRLPTIVLKIGDKETYNEIMNGYGGNIAVFRQRSTNWLSEMKKYVGVSTF